MEKQNGFTLVELLGVIAILALVVLVATPPIINQIKKSQNTFDKATLSLIYSAADSYIDNKQNDYPTVNENTYCVTLDSLIKSGELKKSAIGIDKDSEIVESQVVKITVNNNLYDYVLVEANQCQDYSAPASPELSAGMIPIVYNGTNWVKADITSEWYDYNAKEWANVVLVTEATRTTYQNAVTGTVINEADVLAYLVWIPRYRYKVFNAVPVQEIKILFEDKWHSKSNGSVNGDWLTHPAFTFGTSEVNGFWVGKFETTGSATTPTIKPGINALTDLNVSTGFITSQKFSSPTTYGLNQINDAHIAKNSEWGAIAYLTQSKYGKNSEVWINPSSDHLTGCAGESVATDFSTGCSYSYTTGNGQQASTTGNVSGVYDTSGGSWEVTMGYYTNANSNYGSNPDGYFGWTSTANDAGFISKIEDKYFDRYISTTCDFSSCKGQALNETSTWNGDYYNFISETNPWTIRGGYYSFNYSAGIFSVFNCRGINDTNISFRVVILEE